MRKTKILIILMTISMILFNPVNAYAQNIDKDNKEVENATVMKGTWLSYVDMEAIFKNQDKQTFDDTFRLLCNVIYKNGGNAIFVHVRSHNDAIYPSAIYPWSIHMLAGTDPGYDPLQDMVEIAHQSHLKIHAWINPYGYRLGRISDNPELSTNENIISGVAEIVLNYNVDGIHFDDYFPPIGKENINNMIAQVHQICMANKKTFGIAPQGNIENNRAMGADIDTWLSQKGYIDYIAPQIYWTDEYGKNNVQMSSTRLKEWKALNKINIPMYVGMALYRAGNQIEEDLGWLNSSQNLAIQYRKSRELGYQGYILYSAQNQLMPNEIQKDEITNLSEEASKIIMNKRKEDI